MKVLISELNTIMMILRLRIILQALSTKAKDYEANKVVFKTNKQQKLQHRKMRIQVLSNSFISLRAVRYSVVPHSGLPVWGGASGL